VVTAPNQGSVLDPAGRPTRGSEVSAAMKAAGSPTSGALQTEHNELILTEKLIVQAAQVSQWGMYRRAKYVLTHVY
jgi:hypothetical protein